MYLSVDRETASPYRITSLAVVRVWMDVGPFPMLQSCWSDINAGLMKATQRLL